MHFITQLNIDFLNTIIFHKYIINYCLSLTILDYKNKHRYINKHLLHFT